MLESSTKVFESPVFQKVSNVILLVDDSGRIIFSTPSAYKVFGFGKSTIEGRNVFDFIHIEDAEPLKQCISSLKANSSEKEFHFPTVRVLNSENKYLLTEVEVSSHFAEGRREGLLISLQDVSELRMSEERRKKNQEELNRIQEIGNIGTWHVNLVSNKTYWSDHLFNILGCNRDEVTPSLENYLSRIHPGDIENVQETIKNSGISKKPATFTHRIIDKNKKIRYVHNECRFEFNSEGEMTEIAGILEDVTEQKKAEKKIIQLSKFPEENPNPVLRISNKGEILYCNKAGEFLKELWLNNSTHLKSQVSEAIETAGSVETEITTNEQTFSVTIIKVERSNYVNIYGLDITERKKAETALKDSKQNLQKAFDIAMVGSWKYNMETDVFIWSEHAIRVLGFKPNEVPDTWRDFMNLVPEEEHVFLKSNLVKADKEGSLDIEHRLRVGNTLKWVRVKSHLEYKEDGTPSYSIGIIQDVTDYKAKETKLIENKLTLENAFNIAQIGTWKYSIKNDSYFWSDSAVKVIGFRKQDLPKTWVEFQSFIDSRDWERVLKEVVKSDETGSFEIEHRLNIYGETKWVKIKSHIVNDSENNPATSVGIIQDITDAKKANEEIRKSQAQLTIAADITKLGYWELDLRKGEFTFTDEFYSIFKTTAKKMGGYTMSAQRYSELFLFPEDRELVAQEITNAITNTDQNYSQSLEHRIRYSDGTAGYISVNIFVINDEHGKPVRTFGANQDITERKKHEVKLNKALEEKTSLLSEVHHRVKNNLAIVSGLLELQKMDSEDDKLNQALKHSINRVSSIAMVHELIYQSEDLSSIDIKTYLGKLIPLIEDTMSLRNKEITISVDVDNHMVNINQAIPIGLLLNELLTNSFKYAFNTTKEGRIEVRLKYDDGMFSLRYLDDGIGFDQKKVSQNKSSKLGMTLIKAQLDQLDAVYSLDTQDKFLLDCSFKNGLRGSHSNHV